MNLSERVQVLVLGGGPAGSTAAALLARANFRVRLLEKESFPRFHVGESLIPETYWTFQRLGVLERMKASEFQKKHSVQFISESGKASRPFYFSERDPHESSTTWQVDRAEFDDMLLENARESGAEVCLGVQARKLVFDGDRAIGVSGVGSGGDDFEATADVIIDATGLQSLTARQLGWLRPDPRLIKAAVYAHFENAHRDSGVDEGATVILHTRGNRGWFWYIPLSRNRVSVGVVGESSELLKGRGSPERVLAEEIEGCSAVASRLSAARRVTPVRATSDYSYRAARCAGHGHILVGDAFGFVDPIYSSGVLLALKSGELAADAAIEGFSRNDFSAAVLGAFGAKLASGMEAFRRLIYAFYTPGFSFADFVSRCPQHREELVRMLIGDVFRGGFDDLFASMRPFCDLPEPQPLQDASADR